MNKMKEKEEVEDVGSASSDSFIDDLDDDDDAPSTAEQDQGSLHSEAPLTEAEIDELVADLLEVESKAAEAQESLEKESLARVESEVREELAENLQGDLLELAVRNEMRTFVEEWETTLDELETESAHLLEQLDGSGIDLPNLYKWIESQAPSGCSTETWRKRTHWVGSQITSEISESIMDAEKFLQSQRPVRRKRGKLLEEGASGFLGRKVAMGKNTEALADNQEKDWRDFDEVVQPQRFVEKENAFGGKHWASVYLASTPQQAANLGLELPGIDEVEEIDDIEGCDPFYADAIANEKEIDLSEEQKKSFRKVNAEDDEIMTRKLHLRLKRRRNRIRSKQECIQHEIDLDDRVAENDINDCIPSNENSQPSLHNDTCVISADFPNNGSNDTSQILETELARSSDSFNELHSNKLIENGNSLVVAESTSSDLSEPRGEKRSHDSEDEKTDTKRSRTVVIDSDDEVHADEDKFTSIGDDNRLGSQFKSVNVDSPHSLNVIDTSENFQCTACSKVMGASVVHQHPLLKVIVCANCKTMIEEKMQEKDPDCSECYCGWCGRSNDLISCKACKLLFCLMCIKRNFGEECLSQFQASGWHCFGCSPSILQGLTVECEKALAAKRVLVSSSESDSEVANSISDSTKKRRKKKIRRILDDAELGEETKQKIAIEKARQEHLKTLKVQITAKSNICDTEACIGNETASVDVLGDVTHGYIVNVVREKDEEPVRIPPSVSVKLKPHQIKGIRFMWENIIQSVRKVRLGDKGLGCILAHTMGLGKTFQVISFLYTSMRGAELGLKCALVVTPVNVLHNWRQEFIKWKPLELKALRIFMLDDVPSDKRLDLFKKWRRKGGVFLIGYTAFRNLSLGKHVKDKHVAREICHALQDGPDILVCDEAHMIKNTRADTTHALKQVKCQRRIALTGSPLQNNLMEYYCMVDFVREGFLGSSHEFRNRFQNPIENGQHANATSYDVKVMNQRSHILYEQLKGFVQRMDMNVVKKDLPPKTVYVISVKLSPLQRKLYKKFLDVHGFTSDKVSGEKVIRKSCFFAGYQALAQIWSHPGLLQMAKEHRDHLRGEDAVENFLVDDISSDDNAERDALTGDKQRTKNDFTDKKSDDVFLHKDWWKDLLHEKIYKEVEYSGKMVLLLDILSMSSEVGDKALVFSQSLTTLDLIEFYLSKLPRHGKEGRYWKQGKDWYRLDGSTAGSERQKMVEKFNEPLNTRVKCTLISTRAGSLGINLYAANRVIIVDGSWNPTHDLQAIYRVWRYGQKKPVYAYRLMAHGTMEEKIYKRQVTKEGLAARVVDKQQIHRTMSKEEMLHLFDFGDDENSDADGAIASQCAMKQDVFDQAAIPLKQRLPNGTLSSSDRLMERLLNKHYPRWMANYHEHETLLQENEEEKLSKEEQDMAWEMFQRNTEWEEVQKVPVVDDSTRKQQPVGPVAAPDGSSDVVHNKGILRNQCIQRKCTNLSHMLTLRSQGTKHGCSTICGECAQEITWEGLNRHGK